MSLMSVMRGGRTASAAFRLVFILAAFLAGALPAGPASAETDADRPSAAGEETRVQSYARELPSGANEGAKLESLLGREVKTRDDDPGRIIDILVDRDGSVRAAVVELGGFLGIGTRKIAVEWSMLRFEAGPKQPILVLDMTRDQLRSAPEYRAGAPVVFVGRSD